MIIPDINLLLYATITAFPQHDKAMQWWDELLSGTESVGIVAPVALGFVRVATGRRLLTEPLTTEAATDRVTDWLAQPNVRFLEDSREVLDRAMELLKAAGSAGNLTTDAQIAAAALARNAVVATNDADFGRFEGVRLINPLR